MRAESVAFAVVLLGASLSVASESEARERRSPGVAFVPTATGSIGTAPAGPVPSGITPLGAAPARTAQARCGSGRIVGSGAGFCEIN